MENVSISSAMENLCVSEAQAKKLDSLDGNSQDGIKVDIYTMAKLVLAKKDNDEEYVKFYSDSIGKADLSVFLQVQDIMVGTSDASAKEYPAPQYLDKNSGDGSKYHYIKYDG